MSGSVDKGSDECFSDSYHLLFATSPPPLRRRQLDKAFHKKADKKAKRTSRPASVHEAPEDTPDQPAAATLDTLCDEEVNEEFEKMLVSDRLLVFEELAGWLDELTFI